MNQIELAIFVSRCVAICEEMGAVLRQAAFSPNIKDRLDFSCALFDSSGELFAQAAHVPVHLGSMAFAMAYIVEKRAWAEGDMLIFNDPYLGGTHLPDVTLVQPQDTVRYGVNHFLLICWRQHLVTKSLDLLRNIPFPGKGRNLQRS